MREVGHESLEQYECDTTTAHSIEATHGRRHVSAG
jgi:hypothetical protein